MYLFSRIITVRGDPRKTMSFLTGMLEMVNRKTDLDMSLWMMQTGAPVGTFAYTCLAQTRTELEAKAAPLESDDEYLAAVADGEQYSAALPQDNLMQIMHNAGREFDRPGVGAIGTVTTAQIANGQYSPAMQWSVEIADLVSSITGFPTLFGVGVGGPFGQVGWVGTSPDLAADEAMNEALNKEPHYLAKMDAIGGLFVEGSGQRTISRRIA